jgi:hypothetical protein
MEVRPIGEMIANGGRRSIKDLPHPHREDRFELIEDLPIPMLMNVMPDKVLTRTTYVNLAYSDLLPQIHWIVYELELLEMQLIHQLRVSCTGPLGGGHLFSRAVISILSGCPPE